MINVLATLALLILATASLLLGLALVSYVRGPSVLSAFEGSNVLLERRDGAQVSGILHSLREGISLQSAMQLVAGEPATPAHILLSRFEYDQIESISRPALKPVGRRSAPAGARRRDRWLRRLGDLMAILLQQPPRAWRLTIAQKAALVEAPLLGYTGNRYDPLLESCLQRPVIFQCLLGHARYEYMGILAGYDPDFLLLRNVLRPRSYILPLPSPEQPLEREHITIRRQANHLSITNTGPHPLLLDELIIGEQRQELGMLLAPDGSFHLHLDPAHTGRSRLHCQIVEESDLILPRHSTLVRARPDSEDIVPLFDAGLALETASLQSREEELRQELRRRPGNVLAIAALGRLLYRQGRWQEAETYLRQALQNAHALPDGGARVRVELSLLQQRQANN